MAKATARFAVLINDFEPDDADNEVFRDELRRFLHSFGKAGLRVLQDNLLREGLRPEMRHAFFMEIAAIDDGSTLLDRRTLLNNALRSTDASVRYSAAIALGSILDDAARMALRDQRVRERNPAVRKMIQAQLA